MDGEAFRILNAIMQWIIAPVSAFVWVIYRQQQKHETAIAVLQSESLTSRVSHDREVKEIRETTRAIMNKLDSIEEALRK